MAGPPWWSEHLGGRTTWVAGPRSTRPAGSKHGRFMFRVLPSSNFGQRWTWPQTLLFHSLRVSPSKFQQKDVAQNMAVSFVCVSPSNLKHTGPGSEHGRFMFPVFPYQNSNRTDLVPNIAVSCFTCFPFEFQPKLTWF